MCEVEVDGVGWKRPFWSPIKNAFLPATQTKSLAVLFHEARVCGNIFAIVRNGEQRKAI